jgi:bifunctional DNA-binding transcriptional regulator/antitoxin component of YhaV-PrlF toxin-antitoxin module
MGRKAVNQLSSIAAYLLHWQSGGMTFHGYVGLQSRGLIALPSELRRRMHLDEPGAQVEVIERGDGVIELRAALPVPADQAWFWTEQWQRREREVDEHVARGEVAVHESTDDFLTHLDEIDSPAAKS